MCAAAPMSALVSRLLCCLACLLVWEALSHIWFCASAVSVSCFALCMKASLKVRNMYVGMPVSTYPAGRVCDVFL